MNTYNIFKAVHGSIAVSDLELIQKLDGFDFSIYKVPEKNCLTEYVLFNGYDFAELPSGVFAHRQSLKDYLEMVKSFMTRVSGFAMKNAWRSLFSTIDKRIGLSVYVREFESIPDDQKYDSFIAIYTRAEFGFELLTPIYHKIFEYADYSNENKTRLKTLNKKFIDGEYVPYLFHGLSIEYPVRDFYSWTLHESVAEKFAFRYSSNGIVVSTDYDASKITVIDFIQSRNEAEIICIPNDQIIKLLCGLSDKIIVV